MRADCRAAALLCGVALIGFAAGGPVSATDTAADAAALNGAVSACNTALADPVAAEEQALLDKLLATAKAQNPKAPPPPALGEMFEDSRLADRYKGEAAAKLAAVATAPNPETARDLLHTAEDLLRDRRNLVRRVAETLRSASGERGGTASPSAIRLNGSGDAALAQLMRAANAGQQAEGRTAFFEAQLQPRDALAYNAASEQLTVPQGGTIGVRSLVAAFRPLAPANVPLFEPVRTPGRTVPAVELNPIASERFHAAQNGAQLQQVGGVALKVTLDLLEFLEVPDFRKPGPATVVDRPVLLSLARVLGQAQPFANDWAHLPDDVRFPGGIERVYGFVVDPKRQDVTLIGSPAKDRASRLDLDSLIVALRSVWSAGLTPAVSLDAAPMDPSGPQMARIAGVPERSRFARVMLDADYAMKRIQLGHLRTHVAGYKNVADFLSESPPSAGARASRAWFYPAPLGLGDVQVSASARTVLFNSALTVLSEGLRATAEGYVREAREEPASTRATESFTNAMDEMERSDDVVPRGIFVSLHGLLDLVTLCDLWRKTGTDVPVLRALSRLPLRELEPGAAAPAYYPGITTRFAGARATITLSGGVLARIRATQGSLYRNSDIATAALESGADAFANDTNLARSLDVRLTLPQAGAGKSKRDGLMAAGREALARGDVGSARDAFAGASGLDPRDPYTWAYLAEAQAQLGAHAAASSAIAEALKLAPLEPEIRKLALDVELRATPRPDLSGRNEATRRALSEDYALEAAGAFHAGRTSAAQAAANAAIRLWDGNADAYYIRALTLHNTLKLRELDYAIERFRMHPDALTGPRTRRLAQALATRAFMQFESIDVSAAADGIGTGVALSSLQHEIAQLEEARNLAPDDPWPITAEALMQDLSSVLLRLAGRGGSARAGQKALDLANEAVSRFPDVPVAHSTRASVLVGLERDAEALAELNTALGQNPLFAHALLDRARLYARTGRCDLARADLAAARARQDLSNPVDAAPLAGCP